MAPTETKNNVSLGTGDGSNEVLRPCPLQLVRSQRSGRSIGSGGKSHIGGKRKKVAREPGSDRTVREK